ncbi:uncharacterized protein Fot_35910 [Forsythia ovata]|uniref:Uncharacterized protein n=1 Tax=Forsythia ovata TaxID=205694 RepID=A0ABD1SMY1_9LAMI
MWPDLMGNFIGLFLNHVNVKDMEGNFTKGGNKRNHYIGFLEIGVKMKNGLIYTISGCLRSVCNHPFLVGVLGFLILLYRSTPSVFSLLVYASPVLVCTAILLGILLSFGELNLPDVEIEEKTTHETVSLKTGVSGDTTVVERIESYSVERYSENGRNVVKQTIEESITVAGKISEIDRENSLDDPTPSIEVSSLETELENGITVGENRELDVLRDEQKSEVHEVTLGNGEVMQNQYSSIREEKDEYLELDDGKSEADSFDSKRVYVDLLDSPPRTTWKGIEEEEEEEEEEETEEDEGIDSGSGGDESSSPDASMTDIIPMLDELHPLLDVDAPQPVQSSHDGSDAASECSLKSSTSSHELDDEIDNPMNLEVEDDDNQDVEDEEEIQELLKSAITWTEEDQKNLMDLGSSEIERNQQLEKLLARRRARKNMSMLLEKDMIDFESSDLAFNIAAISTTRQNPFDLPRDSHDNLRLPPVPGSAPSALLPGRNPFDIPYNSTEDKPNLRGDGFQEDFMTFQSSEPFFQRVETFNVEPSFFAANRHDRQDINLRPYFVPEQAVSEESSYSQFQGKSNELRNSKASFILETESIDSAEDLEDAKLAEVHISQEENTSLAPVLISTMEEVIDTNLHQEPESISKMEQVPENVGHRSQSSEEVSLELGQVKKRYVEVQLGDAQIHYEEGSVAQVQEMEFESKAEAGEQRYSRGSSSSSLSEVSEKVFTETAGEGSSVLDERRDVVAEEPGISTRPSLESTDLTITRELVDDPHKEPVYDSSPPEVRKNLSSSSMSSDMLDMDFLPVLVKQTVPLIRRDSEESDQELEEDSPNTIEMPTESSNLHPVNENDWGPKFVTHIRECDNVISDTSGVVQRSDSAGASVEENPTYQHDSYQQTESQVSSASCDADNHVMTHVVGDHTGESLSKFSEDQNLDRPDYDKHSLVSDANLDEVVYHENEKPISANYPDGKALSHSDNDLASSNKSVNEQPFNHHSEVQDASNIPIESKEEVRTMDNLNIPEVPEFDHEVSPSINYPSSPEFISIPSNDSETTAPPGLLYSEKCTGGEATSSRVDVQTIIEDADEIKEIDEGILSELDSIGDFNVSERGSSSNELEKLVDCGRESLYLAHKTGNTSTREVNSSEVKETEHAMDLEKLKEEIDIHEEAMESFSELQTYAKNAIQLTDLSERELSGSDVQKSLDPLTSKDELHPEENETTPADSMVDQNLNLEELNSGMPEVDAKSVEDIDSDFEKTELTSVETEIIDKKIEKPVVVEPTQAELFLEETIAEHSEGEILHRNSSQAETVIDAPVLEVSSIEDVTLDHMQVHNGSVEIRTISDSIDNVLHVVDLREIQRTTSELHLEESIPSEFNGSVPNQSEEGNMEKQLGPKSEDGSAEVGAHEAGSSKDVESGLNEPVVQEMKTVAAEIPDHEVEIPKDSSSTTSVKGKRRISEKSSSSSSSRSSSSDSGSE